MTEAVLGVCRSSRDMNDAICAAKRQAKLDPGFESELFRYLTVQLASRPCALDAIERTLVILESIACPGRMAHAFRCCITHKDPNIRSKAVLVLGSGLDTGTMLMKLSGDEDPRVRANTMEALWGQKSAPAREVFSRGVNDSNHRVAANAAYGLHLIEPELGPSLVRTMLQSSHTEHRIAGAWLIRKIGKPFGLPLLADLIRDTQPAVRQAGFKALTTLRGIPAPE